MDTSSQQKTGLFSQPKAVWAVAFACVISFMGIGLVDPILPAIAAQLHASPSEVSLLFTSYLLVTGFMMFSPARFPAGSAQNGRCFSDLFYHRVCRSRRKLKFNRSACRLSRRLGLGNALFISTALAVIVGVSVGGSAKAIILYE